MGKKILSKTTRFGLVIVTQETYGYTLTVNGVLKETSSDLDYILSRVDFYS